MNLVTMVGHGDGRCHEIRFRWTSGDNPKAANGEAKPVMERVAGAIFAPGGTTGRVIVPPRFVPVLARVEERVERIDECQTVIRFRGGNGKRWRCDVHFAVSPDFEAAEGDEVDVFAIDREVVRKIAAASAQKR